MWRRGSWSSRLFVQRRSQKSRNRANPARPRGVVTTLAHSFTRLFSFHRIPRYCYPILPCTLTKNAARQRVRNFSPVSELQPRCSQRLFTARLNMCDPIRSGWQLRRKCSCAARQTPPHSLSGESSTRSRREAHPVGRRSRRRGRLSPQEQLPAAAR
jgi:hypothetical protein